MKQEYYIVEIKGGYDVHYGDIAIVCANPVRTTSMGMKFGTPYPCNATEQFFFPSDESIITPIIEIARGQGIWYPNEDDFEEESVWDKNSDKQIKIYRHASFWGDDYDRSFNSGNTPQLIPNKEYKVSQLEDQFYRNGWYHSMGLRGYVQSLAEGADVDVSTFWGWLFDNPQLNGLMPWQLPSDYQESYESFLNMFEDKF